MSADWPQLARIIEGSHHILLTSHIRPDCDALGSELGMAAVLEAVGKQVRIVNGQATPDNLAFIDPERRIQALGQDVQLADLSGCDLIMVLDTSAWAQLGPMADVLRQASCRKVVVDHHVSGDDLGAELFKDTSSEATGRLVVELADELGVALTPRIAVPLFAALATDTGWYHFSSTRGDTYRLAGRLTDAGANPPEIFGQLYERDTLGRVRLRGLVLQRIRTELDGRLAWTHIQHADFAQCGAETSDTEDMVNLALGIQGTEAAVILIQQAGGGYKVSFRSRCQMDCSRLAEQFGGGGHKAAAGAFVAGDWEEVAPRVLDAVRKAMG
ncbi:MAG: bifunctional oligoribonuclease/PAP phosphatase NrnA [Pirellulaceae bacterium]|nr:bifunctional oligoribonuclease/PAP phosphatase NrnA [Pirellulaceae bacterium]